MNDESYLDDPLLLGVIPKIGITRGLTFLDNQLFVVRAWSTQVTVYDTNYLTLTHSIPITGSSSLHAIVASQWYNCLYISDIEQNVIYRYNLSDNVLSNWSVAGMCYGLSLANTHNILATLRDTQEIKKYTMDGILVSVIRLDSSIKEPQHSIQLYSDQYVVSHGGARSSVHRVCIVDTSGRIHRCYGGSKGSGARKLHAPTNLAVDRLGNIHVVDYFNDRVVLLSPSLIHFDYITKPCLALKCHKLTLPYALHLDLLTRRLFIGEASNTGRVFVLNV